MLSEWCREQMRRPDVIEATVNYLNVLLEQGDWLNDFAADVPECGRHLIITAGQLLALALDLV